MDNSANSLEDEEMPVRSTQVSGVLNPTLLAGKRAVVTGAARGIGAAIARELSTAGADLSLYDLSDCSETANAIRDAGGEVTNGVLDVSDRAAVTRAFEDLDRLDILVTSAGVYGEPVGLGEIDTDEFDRVMGINLKGSLWTVSAALPLLRRTGGNIVCVGSAAGKVGGVASGPHYVASKGALHAAVKWLARTEAANGIVANAVAPGAIDTDMIAGKGYGGDYCPLGRLGTAEDVAGIAAFLASPGAAYMTGAIVDVNGGFFMG
ncbi:SDR family NAD(P)-dependent oxidoreductase [Rhodococcus opacus]|uniref:SDR family NAD(P)-dependent oxidoreductase n=1 Tax=Rhodococcus opacus TaxID=37919 RepID=UPI00223641C7|nr:SDR family oxidoreductase [Rhodococcus opacus]UZG59908.1 SDR family oxidoreductase [Rhodococcus opacus]